jgi:hypothetical protein
MGNEITIPALKCKVFKQHNTNLIADFRLLQPGLYSDLREIFPISSYDCKMHPVANMSH